MRDENIKYLSVETHMDRNNIVFRNKKFKLYFLSQSIISTT